MSPEVTSDVFSRLESTKKSYLKTKDVNARKEEIGAHTIRLPKGAIPDYVKLTAYQKFCWKTLGKFVVNRVKPNSKLELNLQQAHMRMRVEEFISYVYMSALIVFAICLTIGLVFGGVLIALLNVNAALVLIFTIMIIILPPLLTLVVLNSMPGSKAKTRKRDIDKRIGAAMSFISAMASADVNIDVIFKELARQPIYGEIKTEAEWITRDTELLGIDIPTAIGKAAQRTPSSKFQEFLQGVVTTATSGGQLKPYFLQKAEQFEKEAKLDMRAQLETLGLMAETFVTVVVAFPLFLVVIMAIMAIVPGGSGASAGGTVLLLYLVVGLMIPFSQFGFIFFIWNTTKESSM
ncbi:MAG TPA: type II secretion system F family protein [Methanomassiliicoccales archaeon]|nr:type II secretion system F family protein [Methanomassiliicoccales archaeon]